MFSAFFDARRVIDGGAVPFFLVFFGYVWSLWLAKATLARRYRPYADPRARRPT